MLRTLTVEEVIKHSADTRLPADWTSAQRAALVDKVIDVLGLQRVRKSIIGGLDETGSRRGISGGERKVCAHRLSSIRFPFVRNLIAETAVCCAASEPRYGARGRHVIDFPR